jgi:hypothetical protein
MYVLRDTGSSLNPDMDLARQKSPKVSTPSEKTSLREGNFSARLASDEFDSVR